MRENITTDSNGIIEVIIPEYIVEEAKLKASVANVENRFSMYKGKDNIYVNTLSNISELVFGYVFPDATYESTIHYDFMWYNKKVDIKCKQCKFKPYMTFYASVLEDQYYRQQNDVYIFIRVREDFKVAWILGAYKKEDMRRDSILSKVGKTNVNTGYVTKKNSFDLPISKLIKLDTYVGK